MHGTMTLFTTWTECSPPLRHGQARCGTYLCGREALRGPFLWAGPGVRVACQHQTLPAMSTSHDDRYAKNEGAGGLMQVGPPKWPDISRLLFAQLLTMPPQEWSKDDAAAIIGACGHDVVVVQNIQRLGSPARALQGWDEIRQTEDTIMETWQRSLRRIENIEVMPIWISARPTHKTHIRLVHPCTTHPAFRRVL